MTEPAGYWRTAEETLWPFRAGNSAILAFRTLKVVGNGASTRTLMPVKVKTFPSTMVVFGGTMKSEMMSGSPAIAIRRAIKAIASVNNLCLYSMMAMVYPSGEKQEYGLVAFMIFGTFGLDFKYWKMSIYRASLEQAYRELDFTMSLFQMSLDIVN